MPLSKRIFATVIPNLPNPITAYLAIAVTP
jgi:hypothetical protein